MKSMKQTNNGCQEIPDPQKGIVFAMDICKKEIAYRICGLGTSSDLCIVDQSMQGLNRIKAEMDDWKRNGYDVWAGYEPTGPYSCKITEYLLDKGYKVVQINPKHTSMFNDIKENKPGKTDPRDTLGMGGLIWQGCYRSMINLTGVYADLRMLSKEWQTLSVDGTKLRNQLHSTIELWYPELGVVFKDRLCKNARAIMRKYKTVEEITNAGVKRVKSTLKKAAGGSYADRAESIVSYAKASRALSGNQEFRHQMISNLLDRLELIEKQKSEIMIKMESLLGMLPESGFILSIKGIGIVTTATLLGECGNIADYSVGQLEKIVGLNLHEYSSGQHKGNQHISKGGREAARYALCMVATCMANRNGIYHDVAEKMRIGGKCFSQIRVAVARKLLRLIRSLAHNNQSFDLAQFVARRETVDDPLTHQDVPIQKIA